MLRFSLTSTTFPLNTACDRSNSSSTLGNSAHEQALVIEGKELINKILMKIMRELALPSSFKSPQSLR